MNEGALPCFLAVNVNMAVVLVKVLSRSGKLWGRDMCGVTKKDKIIKEHMRGSVKVALTKITEKRIKWYGHVKRKDKGHVLRRMLDAPVPEKRRIGRQKTR